MTSIGHSLSGVVQDACFNAGTIIQTADINRILAKLEEGIGRDAVTIAELHTIDRTIDTLVRQGRLTHDRGAQFSNQIRDAINRAVDKQMLRASAMTRHWITFVDSGANQTIRTMAQHSAANRRHWLFGGNRLTRGEVNRMLEAAARDGTITLSEINSMYGGINDAFNSGRISGHERDSMIRSLEANLKRQAGKKRRGMCARRIKGPYHEKLSPEAKNFIQEQLGGRAGRTSRKGWTTWRFDRTQTQRYVRSITQDGHVSPAERRSLVNHLLRDGRATWNELLTVRQALGWAVWQRAISPQEYHRTLRLFDLEIAQYTGGQRLGSITQDLQVRRHGMYHFQG